MTTTEEFRQQIESATKLVESWPAWKRNILVRSSQPTGRPRSPITKEPIVTATHWKGEVTHKHRDLPPIDFPNRETPQEAFADAMYEIDLLYAEYGDGMEPFANEWRDGKPTGEFYDADSHYHERNEP